MKRILYPFLGVLFLLLLWQGAVAIKLLNPALIDPPTKVADAMVNLLHAGDTWGALWATLRRTLIAFGISALAGTAMGLLLGYFRTACITMQPIIDFLRSIPGAALVPVFIVCLGVGEAARLGLAIVPTTLIVTVYTMLGVKNSNLMRQTYARSLGAPNRFVFSRVIAMEALPSTFAGLRTSISVALVLVLVSEMLMMGSGEAGIGQSIYKARYGSEYASMYAYIALCGMMGYILNICMELADNILIHWRGR